MIRRRHLLYVLAALAVPLPASAVVSGSDAAPALSVSVALDQCGVASTAVVCKLDASFAPIDGARYYTAAVTGPDGSVVDYGDVPSGAASLWVPYVGNGTYTVTVSAWGAPVKYNKPKPIATGTATAGDGGGAVSSTAKPGAATQPSAGAKTTSSAHTVAAGHVGTAPGANSSRRSDSASVTPSKPSATGTYAPAPTCTPVPATPPPPTDPATPPSASGSAGINGVSPGDAQTLQASGVLPTDTTTPDCPDPVTTPDGSCCPPPAG